MKINITTRLALPLLCAVLTTGCTSSSISPTETRSLTTTEALETREETIDKEAQI